jgi:hypothetical protein
MISGVRGLAERINFALNQIVAPALPVREFIDPPTNPSLAPTPLWANGRPWLSGVEHPNHLLDKV